jgi:hypothetical protein
MVVALDDVDEFGVTKELRDQFVNTPSLSDAVQVCKTTSAVVKVYIDQILGFTGHEANIEKSFGGDLLHAFYLPHVDLWRGDRRFSSVLKEALPTYASRVVSTIKELPSAIDAWSPPT